MRARGNGPRARGKKKTGEIGHKVFCGARGNGPWHVFEKARWRVLFLNVGRALEE